MRESSMLSAFELATRILEMMRDPNLHRKPADYAACQKLQNELRDQWAAQYGIKLSKASSIWWGRLLKDVPSYRAKDVGLPGALPCDDHVSLWNKDGKPHLWASQPYNLNYQKLVDAAEEFDLVFSLDKFPSWYYPGHTHLLIWRRKIKSL